MDKFGNYCAAMSRSMKEQRYGIYAAAGTTSPGAGQGDFYALHLESRLGFARYKPSPPLVRALVFIFTLMQSSLVEAVTCPTCVDTIPGCAGGADCPLLKGPVANAGVLAATSGGGTLDVSKMLPPEMLCTFTRPVMETLASVAKAPAGGGTTDLTTLSLGTEVVKAAIHGLCSWEDAGLELASRLEAASDATAVAKLNAALSLLKNTGDKVGTVAQAATVVGCVRSVCAVQESEARPAHSTPAGERRRLV